VSYEFTIKITTSHLLSQRFGEIPDFVTYEMEVFDEHALLGVPSTFRVVETLP
jgi:hypothetical protein